MFFRTGDELEVLIDLRDFHTGHVIGSFCLFDRVRKIKRHTAACDFGGVYAVAADVRRRIGHSRHLTAALHQLVGDDESDIAGTEHQDTFAGQDAVQVHQRLGGTGTDDAGQCPAFKGHHVFGGAGGDDNRIAFDVLDGIADPHDELVILIETDDRGAQADLYAGPAGLLQQFLSDPETADTGFMFFGTEKFMNLFEKLSARLFIFVKYNNMHAASGGLDRRRQTGRSGSDDDKIISLHDDFSLLSAVFFRLFFKRERAHAVLRLHIHAFTKRCDAGTDIRNAVDDHDAVGAAPDGTENASRLMRFLRVAVNHHAVHLQCRRDGFPFAAFKLFAVKCELYRTSLFYFAENGMLSNSF